MVCRITSKSAEIQERFVIGHSQNNDGKKSYPWKPEIQIL